MASRNFNLNRIDSAGFGTKASAIGLGCFVRSSVLHHALVVRPVALFSILLYYCLDGAAHP